MKILALVLASIFAQGCAQQPTNVATTCSKPPATERCTCARPAYPQEAVRLGEQGTTRLQITVGADGSVSDVVVIKSSGSQSLDRASIEAASKVCFVPAKDSSGKPIGGTTRLEYAWKLQ